MSAATSVNTIRPAPAKRNIWIISPVWDLAFLVATPLAILPLIPLISQRWLTPEQISLLVISFASVGHHLPGFMRAYGDKELFARYRWRFLLAPPVFLFFSLLFTSYGLHGLEMIILVWATWHGLMQTYGLMRIYDLKRGINDAFTRGLDFWLCILIFLAGIVFSDARVFGVMEVFWRTGLPYLDAWWLLAARWSLGIGFGLFAVIYAANLVAQWQRGQGVSWLKVALATTTGLLYWLSGTLSTNVLIGVAMFEIFHAIQYYAIVWVYNRRLADRMGEDFGPLGFLFQRKWFFLGLYLLAIGLFGTLRLLQPAMSTPLFEPLLLALFTTSAAMHFYFDGFIWKVSQKNTQQNLGIDSGGPGKFDVSAFTHLSKWGVLGLVCAGLIALESWRAPNAPANEDRIMLNLAEWVPQLPELRYQLSRASLQQGDVTQAITQAEEAVGQRPRSHQMRAQYGAALAAADRLPAAIEQLQLAVQLAPWRWENHYELGRLHLAAGELDKATERLSRANELEGDLWLIHGALGDLARQQGDFEEAIREYRAAIEGKPNFRPAWTAIVECLAARGQAQQAIATARQGLERWPADRALQFALAKSLFSAKNYPATINQLERLLKDKPDHLAALVLLGNATAANNAPEKARDAFTKALALQPDNAVLVNNLAAVQQLLGDFSAAESLLRDIVAKHPNQAATQYNLGLALWSQQKEAAARPHLQRAWELGHPVPARMIAAAGLAPRASK